MKKIIAILLMCVMMVGMFSMAGCQKGGNAKPNFEVPKDGFNVNEPVTITFGHTMGAASQAILEKYIKQFNEIYPNITVEHVAKGGWGDINGTINTEINGGTQPNIVYCYPDHVAMYNLAKSVVNLDNLIASQIPVGDTGTILGLTAEEKADFVDAYYNEGMVYGDGLMYTMPLSKSTEILFYDKDFFAANNLTVPTTWAELWETCAKIKAIVPEHDYPLGYDSEANWFITLCEQYNNPYTSASGDDNYLFDNDANKALMKELRGYYELGYFTTQELYGNYTSGLFTNQDPTKARCYMCIGSSGGTRHQIPKTTDEEGNTTYAFEVGIAPIPQANMNNQKAISQGPSVCILRGKDTTDQQIMASWLLIKFLATNIGFQAEFSMDSGYMPVLKSVTEHETYAKWLEGANGYDKLNALAVKVGIEARDTYFVSPAFNGSTTARNEAGYLLIECISAKPANGQTLDDLINTAFKDAIDECEFQGG